MKREIIAVAITMLLIAGCSGVKTLPSSLEDSTTLEFLGTPEKYIFGVDVTVDNNKPYKVEVKGNHPIRFNRETYSILAGNHLVTVCYRGDTLFHEKIYIEVNENRRIILP